MRKIQNIISGIDKKITCLILQIDNVTNISCSYLLFHESFP